MKVIVLIVSVISLFSCSDGVNRVNLKEEEKRIMESWVDWPKKAEAGDPGFYWAEDAMILGQGQLTVRGKENVEFVVASLQKIPGFSMTWDERPTSIEVSKDGQMAYLFAKNEINMPDSGGTVVKRINQALQVWKKDDAGNWKAAVVVMYPQK